MTESKPRLRVPLVLFVVLVAGSLAACRNPLEDVACTGHIQPGIVVEIRDARDGTALAYGARGAVRDGAFIDSLTPAEGSGGNPESLYSRQAAGERAGTYSVEVVHPGYQPWTTTGVKVVRNVCHVETRRLHANLVPAS